MYLTIYVLYFVVQFQGTLRKVWGQASSNPEFTVRIRRPWFSKITESLVSSVSPYLGCSGRCLFLICTLPCLPQTADCKLSLLESCIFLVAPCLCLHTFFRVWYGLVTPLFFPSTPLCLYPSCSLAHHPPPFPSRNLVIWVVWFGLFFAID